MDTRAVLLEDMMVRIADAENLKMLIFQHQGLITQKA